MGKKQSSENALSKYQKFEVETISRTDIKNAEYNPRTIDENAKKRLQKGLKEHGLVSTLTWNKRTGNLVGGHQRLAVIDALEKNKNYALQVAVIDVDEKQEKIINVQLNNPSMQGEWDLDLLKDLNINGGINLMEMGFTEFDIDTIFGGELSELFTEPDDLAETKGDLEAIKQSRKKHVESAKEQNSANFYFIVVCENQADKADLYKLIGVRADEEYIHSGQVRRLLSK